MNYRIRTLATGILLTSFLVMACSVCNISGGTSRTYIRHYRRVRTCTHIMAENRHRVNSS